MTTTIVTKGIETRKVNSTNKGHVMFDNGGYKKSLATRFVKEQPNSRMMWDRDMAFYYADLKKPYVSISEHEVNVIVSAMSVGNNNIVNNYFDGQSVADEDDNNSLSQDKFLMGRINLVEAAGKYQWLDERGVELSTIDSENNIQESEVSLDEMEEKGTQWRQRLLKEYGVATSKPFQRFVVKYKAERKALNDMKVFLDTKLIPEEDNTLKDARMPSEGNCIEAYLKSQIDKLSVWQLAATMDILEQMRTEKVLSWYYYITCGLAVSARLCKATNNRPEWWELYSRLLKDKRTHHSLKQQQEVGMSPEDRLYGKCSLRADNAVDDIMAAKRISQRHTDDNQTLTEQEVIQTWDTEIDPDMLVSSSGEGVWETMLAAAGVSSMYEG